MATQKIPELNYLLSLVEKQYGRKLTSTSDFESLSIDIERKIRDLISASTLKRLYGYVSMRTIPRKSTLDILSRYIGKKSYDEFCKELKHSEAFTSTFFSAKTVYTCDLAQGDIVQIGWEPDRVVTLEYLGEDSFIVNESVNSQLRKGDRFALNCFMLDFPLYIPRLLRKGEWTTPYIAGTQNGLNLLEVHHSEVAE